MDGPTQVFYAEPMTHRERTDTQPLIGIDTGGTYTDAVLFDEAHGVRAKAKSLTTRADLSIGIGAVLDAVLAEGGVAAAEIGMVAVSTTLATNSIVEGLGTRVCLVAIGFEPADLERAGLREAVKNDVVVLLNGGHDSFGDEVAPLDPAPLQRWIAENADAVGAFAVASRFSMANPDHEDRARALIEEAAGKPVTCSHDLTAKLNGPKRALTSVLNARLIGIIHHLIDATAALLEARAIRAPLMIVKGDGSLLSLAEARKRPIETILSGPAASIVGASYLTGARDAMVSDIGGTTTDIGLLKDGRPRLGPNGATVAGLSTFVEAVAMHTFGLGADSEVRRSTEGSSVVLGPRRVVPVSLLASTHGALVHAVLDRQLAMPSPSEHAGRFAVRTGRGNPISSSLSEMDRELLDALAEAPVATDGLLTSWRQRSALDRLVTFGEVTVAAFSPSDAAHVLGLHAAWDRDAAVKAATLFARQRGTSGQAFAADADQMSRLVLDTLVRTSAEHLLDVALGEDGFAPAAPSRHPLLQAALSRRSGIAEVSARLTLPIVGLGASAPVYYPDVARALSAEAIVPEHADVANAVGAVVGRIRTEALATISRPDDGLFRVHCAGAPHDFHEEDQAIFFAEHAVQASAREKASANGASDVEMQLSREVVSALVGGRDLILEWRFTAVATGRPGF